MTAAAETRYYGQERGLVVVLNKAKIPREQFPRSILADTPDILVTCYEGIARVLFS